MGLDNDLVNISATIGHSATFSSPPMQHPSIGTAMPLPAIILVEPIMGENIGAVSKHKEHVHENSGTPDVCLKPCI